MTVRYYSDLMPVLAERARLAAIARLGFANAPLRRHLAELFSRPYGQAGAFLADPTFEAVFGWRKGSKTMADLAGGLLTPELVEAMAEPPEDLAGEYRFERSQRPYRHQLEAWEILAGNPPQSLVVASGTGSGKTECFMVPILDRLARERRDAGRLTGVRALFLYPLNALINSQRDRLRAWTHRFGGDVRFCLYNGNTPEKLPARELVQQSSEVLDRATLRAAPPSILVTNATMLEYMLVRNADEPIVARSRGMLEWVVLDEAHTYVGSQAAEVALLIRRVLIGFGVRPEQVRFVATSATIGDPHGEAGQQLKRFLAELAGVGEELVHLVAGERQVPSLDGIRARDKAPLTDLLAIDPGHETSAKRYDALAGHVTARRLRDLFVGDPARPPVARLSQVCAQLQHRPADCTGPDLDAALQWLDLLSGTRDNTGEGNNDGASFMPLRAHIFHQTLSGLWACADPVCPHKQGTALEAPEWPFGRLYLEPRKHCECGAPVYDVVSCSDCGAVHLMAGLAGSNLVQWQPPKAIDEFELDTDEGEGPGEDETDEEGAVGARVLIVNRAMDHVGPLVVDRGTRKLDGAGSGTLIVLAHEEGNDGLLCPVCDGRDDHAHRLFHHARLGAPFLLGNLLPGLLEFAPDGPTPADLPYRGRRLLSFNDSRQGTARMAAKLQQDAERNRVRGLVYHLALQWGRAQAGNLGDDLARQIVDLEGVQAATPNPVLAEMIKGLQAKQAELTRPVPIPFNDLAQRLSNQGRDFEDMLARYRRYAPTTFGQAAGPLELARLFLVREFGRRPKRLNNLETMGLVAVSYPALETVPQVPPAVAQAAGFDLTAWRDFLKICLDFFVRAGGSLDISPAWRNWLGMPFPQTFLVERDKVETARNQRRWPRARRSGPRSTLVRLLAHVLQADIATPVGEDRIDAVLQDAWTGLIGAGLLQTGADGRYLPLQQLAFMPMGRAWVCPVTRRLLDTTLHGVTPYLPMRATDATARCTEVTIPLYDAPFGDVTDDLERIRLGRDWLAARPELGELRDQGLWSDLNDRVIEVAPYFTAAEHSAQQTSGRLQGYERAFKSGRLNLLSCSTTMEMGIDIGGISLVAMNNVPPHPANYLQRAGRAGRRREARSLAVTLCKSNPHDQAVFGNTRWAFDTGLPAPRVSLDSAVIVQRHVQSFLLGRFLAQALGTAGQEQTRLTCGSFFLGEGSLAERFSIWCRDSQMTGTAQIRQSLAQILRQTAFEGLDTGHLIAGTAAGMEEVMEAWRLEWDALEAEAQQVLQKGHSQPAAKAVNLRKERMSGEYLLGELTSRGYLPGHGFPTHIVAFDNLTVGEFLRLKQQADREDNRYRRRELASREAPIALREYAPGSEVVMDGLVYRSAGVTLNWHTPADQQQVREIQNIRYAWRCRQCGASGSSASRQSACRCTACGAEIGIDDIREFLEPAGFAVDFYEDPSNDVSTQHFIPVEPPWIDAHGPWLPLTNPDLGRFRVTDRGHLFHQSCGLHGTGYALCLECGRAAPMTPDCKRPAALDEPHRKLRRAKTDDAICPGGEDPWKIKDGIILGHETYTDVLELQLKTEQGAWLDDRTRALTLAVALRDALAGLLGVQATELGCDIKDARPEVGTRCRSILIFDRFAAGYASSAAPYLPEMFRVARRHLECPAGCDSACPHCVLDFDQRFAAESLDRNQALTVLTDDWLNRLSLPEDLAFFGVPSYLEYLPLGEAVRRTARRLGSTHVHLFAGGDVREWDLGPSPLRGLAYTLAGQGLKVDIILPEPLLQHLEEADRHLLASLADHPSIAVSTHDTVLRAGSGWVLAEIEGKSGFRWAVPDAALITGGPDWGPADGLLIGAHLPDLAAAPRRPLQAAEIRPPRQEGGDREIEVQHELNGPIGRFGNRLWTLLREVHSQTQTLLVDPQANVTQVEYRDRYLFSPLSVALLGQLILGLRQAVGRDRWAEARVEVVTATKRADEKSRSYGRIWSDWPDMDVRNRVLEGTMKALGLPAAVRIAGNVETGHGRLLQVRFSTDQLLTVRFDQGVSYWRAASATPPRHSEFDFSGGDPNVSSEALTRLLVDIEGGQLPTQLFVKVR